jgi:hypothetical protein
MRLQRRRMEVRRTCRWLLTALTLCIGVACTSGHGETAARQHSSATSHRHILKPHTHRIRCRMPPLAPPHASGPVLGYRGFARCMGGGWGVAAPRTVQVNGDGTDGMGRMRWIGWGSPVAIANGEYNVIRPHVGGHVGVRGQLRASDLGRCFGRIAYRRVEFRAFYPRHTSLYRKWGKHERRWRPYVRSNGNVCRSSNLA